MLPWVQPLERVPELNYVNAKRREHFICMSHQTLLCPNVLYIYNILGVYMHHLCWWVHTHVWVGVQDKK